MKPAILLYNPPATADEKKWVRPLPLNLLSICSIVNQEEFDISIVQEMPNKAYENFKPNLDNAICLGISCMTGTQIRNALMLAKKIKKTNPGITIIWGGYHPTATPEQTLQNEMVDIIVRGYGEIAFSELIERLANKQNYEDIQGISYKKNGTTINNPCGPIPNLNDLPPLPYNLIDVEQFFAECGDRTLHYISSRGCPHKCGFCADYVIYKRKWNALSAERVLADLEELKKKYNYDSVRFYDSNLFVNEKRINEICKGVIEKKLNFKWLKCNGDAFGLARYSPDTLQLMNRAGVTNILLGVESGHQPALDCIQKTAKIKDNFETARLLHKNNISIGFSFMFGFPYNLSGKDLEKEHKKEITSTMKTIAMFSEDYLSGDYYLFFLFTPYPGVRLFQRYKELGYIPSDSLEGWSHVNLNESDSCPWVAKDLLKRYHQCLKINWFFMHKLERNIFWKRNNPLLRRYARYCCERSRKILRKRINREQLSLPFLFKVINFYLRAKSLFLTQGYRGFVRKVFK
ncbi:MAG: B12-binding domain-containing radical SAM protein [Anaerohalosphaeraceae bacterium]|nr:B12-binding domain-containing radical SAM protein [Anaerohalosphaeraceae bacterium]